MSWFPVDDAFHSHPKARKAGLEALGLWTLAGSHCMAYLTDGFVADWWVKEKPRGAVLAKRLVAAGLWSPAEHDGEQGWQFHDWKVECTKAHVLAERRASAARQEVARNPQLRGAIRERDGDVCRYCGTPVEWHNRRGPTGGTYDHVIPDGGTTIDNLVVCCRGCNSKKGRRTPEQAGMKLRPVPKVGVRSELDPALDGSRSVLGETQPNPTQPINSLVDSGGGVTQVAPTGPRPKCAKHEENSGDKCRDCMRRRLWDEQHDAALSADELEQRRRQREIAQNCGTCHGTNWIPDTEPAVKCTHQEVLDAAVVAGRVDANA